ncbi:MAG: hypothetical protein IJW03_03775 [Clostridia bacterium]|nr:hypothetical protein [Clostridia bacterium]
MYSRNYFDTELPPASLPENYVGTAFSETEPREIVTPTPEPDEPCESTEASAVPSSAHAQRSPIGSLFGGIKLPFLENLRLPEIGSEEILIIATAIFLLLSKNGDKECAVMLLLLLLVN